MQENQLPSPAHPAPSSKKPFYKRGWFVAVAAVGIALLIAAGVIFWLMGFSRGAAGSEPTKALFYSMIETAAQQNKIRYGYESIREERPDEMGIHVLSLAEYDYPNKKFNTVYAYETILARSERCVDGTVYTNPDEKYPDDFAQALQTINAKSEPYSGPNKLEACDFRKIRTTGHFTDTILPIGLSSTQAKSMADDLRNIDAVELKDEGVVSYKGKAGRKIAFELNPEKTGLPYKPETFFFSFRDGTSSKVGANGIKLDNIPEHRNGDLIGYGAIKGVYVIDETTKLPLYSEITLSGSSQAEYLPTTTWSTYEYPSAFTITPTSQLPTIERLGS